MANPINNNRPQPPVFDDGAVRPPMGFLQEQGDPLDVSLQTILGMVNQLQGLFEQNLPNVETTEDAQVFMRDAKKVFALFDAKVKEFETLEPNMQPLQRDLYLQIVERVNAAKNWVDNNIAPLPAPLELQGRAVPLQVNAPEVNPFVIQAFLQALQGFNQPQFIVEAPVQQANAQPAALLPAIQQQPAAPQQEVPQPAAQQANPQPAALLPAIQQQPAAPQQAAPQPDIPQAVNGLEANRVSLIQKMWSPIKKVCSKIYTIVIELLRYILPFLFKKAAIQPQIQQPLAQPHPDPQAVNQPQVVQPAVQLQEAAQPPAQPQPDPQAENQPQVVQPAVQPQPPAQQVAQPQPGPQAANRPIWEMLELEKGVQLPANFEGNLTLESELGEVNEEASRLAALHGLWMLMKICQEKWIISKDKGADFLKDLVQETILFTDDSNELAAQPNILEINLQAEANPAAQINNAIRKFLRQNREYETTGFLIEIGEINFFAIRSMNGRFVVGNLHGDETGLAKLSLLNIELAFRDAILKNIRSIQAKNNAVLCRVTPYLMNKPAE